MGRAEANILSKNLFGIDWNAICLHAPKMFTCSPPRRLLIRERQTCDATHQNACTGKQSLQYSSLSADCGCKFVLTPYVNTRENKQRQRRESTHSLVGTNKRADTHSFVGECWIYLCVLHHVITRIPVTNLSSSTCQWLHLAVLARSLALSHHALMASQKDAVCKFMSLLDVLEMFCAIAKSISTAAAPPPLLSQIIVPRWRR
jgi:hypothetical protein